MDCPYLPSKDTEKLANGHRIRRFISFERVTLTGVSQAHISMRKQFRTTPTFPYANVPPKLKAQFERLRIVDPSGETWKDGIPSLEFEKVLVPWLNARLLGLDPVFPIDAMARIGATLSFEGDAAASSPSDLLWVSILSFRGAGEIDLDSSVGKAVLSRLSPER